MTITTKSANNAYRDGWERIFGSKKSTGTAEVVPEQQSVSAEETGSVVPRVKARVKTSKSPKNSSSPKVQTKS